MFVQLSTEFYEFSIFLRNINLYFKSKREALADVEDAVNQLRYFAGLATKPHGQTYDILDDIQSMVVREAVGVVRDRKMKKIAKLFKMASHYHMLQIRKMLHTVLSSI
ncbi:aldehyde dehydrogenase family protein [Peribacillus butanolivorans]|uniref:aldehyde dehydrogenase family protein n=1 Tax=Peribacillus butanolivorans TaxID=421767 RepID=UPI0036687D2B